MRVFGCGPGRASVPPCCGNAAVLIATRHHLHAPLVVHALRANRHVFVEKPLCLMRTELAEIDAALAESVRIGAGGLQSPFRLRERGIEEPAQVLPGAEDRELPRDARQARPVALVRELCRKRRSRARRGVSLPRLFLLSFRLAAGARQRADRVADQRAPAVPRQRHRAGRVRRRLVRTAHLHRGGRQLVAEGGVHRPRRRL